MLLADMDWLNENSGAIQAISTVLLVLLTAAYAVLLRRQIRSADRQVEMVAKGSQTQATIDIMMFLQAEYVRDARRTVRSMRPSENWERDWTAQEIEAVGIVCSSFDAVAMLAEHDLMDPEPFTTGWAVTLVKCYEVCEPYIRSLREDQSGPTFWSNFERAAAAAAKKLEIAREAPIPT